MPNNWNAVFQAVQAQGRCPPHSDPKSPSDVYFAYIDKADWDDTANVWYLMFDMVPAEAALLGLAGSTGDAMPAPILPTIIFHATGALQAAVSTALQLTGNDEPAEGSWYVLYLEKGGDRKTQVVGELHHPDTDFLGNKVPSYDEWYISAADLIVLPGSPQAGMMFSPAPPRFQAASRAKTLPRTYARLRLIGIHKANRFKPHRKALTLVRRRVRPPPPPAPPPPGYGALGVMGIGQGGFNLFFARATREPEFYYDTGYPLGFFLSSVPPAMRVGNGAFQGPIFQNAAATLDVVLSHWDWDHWRFGAFTNGAGQHLGQLAWTVPAQPMSPTAVNFLATVAVVAVVPVGAPAQARPNGTTVYKLQPPMGAAHAFYVNNSGLAVRVPVDLAGIPAANVLLTGDGNFSFLPGAALAGLHVIGAVHHGSNNHGAAANLPAAPGGTTGRIAYSYGVNPVNGNHAYGFPNGAAIAAYQAGNWNVPTQESTAEGANLNVGPVAAGNIRVGDQGALPAAYAATAFAAISSALP
jgi:hypothetical protein